MSILVTGATGASLHFQAHCRTHDRKLESARDRAKAGVLHAERSAGPARH